MQKKLMHSYYDNEIMYVDAVRLKKVDILNYINY